MRSYFVSVLALVLSACTPKPERPSVAAAEVVVAVPGGNVKLPRARFVMSDQNGVITLVNYEFKCAHESVKGGDKYAKCLDIPVVVLWVGDTNVCKALVPYNTLRINSTKENKPTKVTWTILGPVNAKFDDKDGVKVKERQDAQPQDPKWKDVFEDGKSLAGGRTFEITLKDGAPKGAFLHDATVFIGTTKCEPIDPLIVNADN